MIENPPSPLPWNLIVKPQIFIKKAHFLIKLWVNTEIWYFLTSEGLQWGFLWSAPWIFELLQGFWNKMWKFIRPFMKWLFSMKTPTREGWLLAHFTPKPWEQLQNPGSNFKILGATSKSWEELQNLKSHSKTLRAATPPSFGVFIANLEVSDEMQSESSTPNGLFINIPYPLFCILSVLNHVFCIMYPLYWTMYPVFCILSVLNHVFCIMYPLYWTMYPVFCILNGVSSVISLIV